MSDLLSKIRELRAKATKGPWIDLTETYHEACLRDKKARGKWYHGSDRACMPIALIVSERACGERIETEHIPLRYDKYDFKRVVSVFWSDLPKKAHMATCGMRPEDRALIIALVNHLDEIEKALEEQRP